MANTEVLAGQIVTHTKLNELTYGTTAPATPVAGNLWVDTSVGSQATPKVYGTAWNLFNQSYKSVLLGEYTAEAGVAAVTANQTIRDFTSLSIPANDFIKVRGFVRVANNEAGTFVFGLKVNTVIVADTGLPAAKRLMGIVNNTYNWFEFIIGARNGSAGTGWCRVGGNPNTFNRVDWTMGVNGIANGITTSLTLTGQGYGTGVTNGYLAGLQLWQLKP